MHIQSIVGNMVLLIDAEMFGRPSLRAKWKEAYGGGPEDIHGLSIEEHVYRLRDTLAGLAERFPHSCNSFIR
jgi:hypothetical protein